ncbi:MAG: DNA-formamidopyrimidine glycosylase [Patescibacteria group bacterium]
MPELPEVETIVRSLNKTVLGRKIEDVWSDTKKIIKRPQGFGQFKKEIIGRKIESVKRRAKNILIGLSGNKILLIHQKMTGHLLAGRWKLEDGRWKPLLKGPLEDSVNLYIHLMFQLSGGGLMLALSDLRKFAKVEFLDKEIIEKELSSLGPEPLEKSFTFEKFKDCFKNKKGKIKQILMKPEIIAGIGNIYSDEILWEAKIHPSTQAQILSRPNLNSVYRAMKKILNKAIELQGDSMSDYRLITGEKGGYQNVQKVYRQEGKHCPRKDGGVIERLKIGGRSAHFCPICQRI